MKTDAPRPQKERTFIAIGCRTPGHQSRSVRARGVCGPCYNAARDLVEVQRVCTWEQLERAGKVLPVSVVKSYMLEGVKVS
jgi:hypothetical protein